MQPIDEYDERKARWSDQQAAAQRSFIAIGNGRLLTAVAGIALAWLALGKGMLSVWVLVLPLGAFVLLVVWHQRVLRRRRFAERGIRFYEQAINRIQDKWAGSGNQGEAFRRPEHVYADDLDVFGRGSLFELLSNARTAAGENTLAEWLMAPASTAVAQERQASVRELAPLLDLREGMALLGEDIQSSIDVEILTTWGNAPPVRFPAVLRVVAMGLAIAGFVSLVLKFVDVWPIWPLLAVLAVNGLLMFLYRAQIGQVEGAIEAAAHQLSLLSLLVQRLEGEEFSSRGLVRLREEFKTSGKPASRCIRNLDRWLELLDSSDHILLRVLEPVVLYKKQIAMAVEAWRAKNGAAIGKWIRALAEFEALSSLGALHYERPTWNFPKLDDSESPKFSASELGHPLIASAVAVRNNVELAGACRLLIVSGSNMSGKSTLLRAVGLSTVLAWAGAPVCATELAITRLQVGASLRVSDSLQDNRSRFFAEISRLRQIVDLTHEKTSVLFLLDELLSGTNSHDRLIGATGVVRGLMAAHTIGMMTTHDLALTQLAGEVAFAARNVHLEDRIVEGKMEFDYHLRSGVVTHSNALELMRSIGLEI